MRIGVVGAGPAGLTAAYRLRASGHEVVVYEARDVAGGRTHTEHFGPGHYADTGAGWLASFYPDTLALLEGLGERRRLRHLQIRGGGELRLDGRLVPNPNSVRRILATPLLTPPEKVRFMAFMAALLATQRGRLRLDAAWDDRPATAALAGAGRRAAERIVRPSFEGPFFARLEEMSGALVRSWLRDLSVGSFFRVEGGMDAPWRALAADLGVRTGSRVRGVRPLGRDAGLGVEVAVDGEPAARFDAAILAVPAPVALEIVPDHDALPILRQVRYAPHVRLYAARRGDGPPRSGIHAFPNRTVATVERSRGGDGAWGAVPDDWEWQLVCAPAASSAELLGLPDEELRSRLWSEALTIDPGLFPLDKAEVSLLVRWTHAVPVVDQGYLARLAALVQRPPIVFAGDWLVQPCVEGAVRSGNAAARVLTGA